MTSPRPAFGALAFFLADHAVVESGKLYVHGGYGIEIAAPAFPLTSPASLVAVLSVPWGAHNADHALSVHLIDHDGAALPFEVTATFRSGTTPFMNPGEPTILPLAFPLLLSLPQPGRYCFTLSVDEEELDRYSFRVRQVSQVVALPPPAPAGGDPGPGRR